MNPVIQSEIEVVFDKDKPTFMNIIKQQFKNLNPMIKQ